MIRNLTLTSFFLLSINAYAQGSNSQSESSQDQTSEEHANSQATSTDIITSLKQAEISEPVMLTPMLTGSIKKRLTKQKLLSLALTERHKIKPIF